MATLACHTYALKVDHNEGRESRLGSEMWDVKRCVGGGDARPRARLKASWSRYKREGMW